MELLIKWLTKLLKSTKIKAMDPNVNGKIIPENEQVKPLCVTIDSNLYFSSHIKEICGKVSQKTSALVGLRDYISGEKAI